MESLSRVRISEVVSNDAMPSGVKTSGNGVMVRESDGGVDRDDTRDSFGAIDTEAIDMGGGHFPMVTITETIRGNEEDNRGIKGSKGTRESPRGRRGEGGGREVKGESKASNDGRADGYGGEKGSSRSAGSGAFWSCFRRR